MEEAYLNRGAGYTRISAGGNVMQDSRFDGTKGSESAMGQVTPMEKDKMLDTKRSFDMLSFLHLVDYRLSAELLGIDRINEVPHYLIELRRNGAVAESHWFNVETGLRTRTVRTETTPRGDMSLTLDYGAMTEAKGMLFEGEVTMKTGGQEMKMTVNTVDVNPKIDAAEYKVD